MPLGSTDDFVLVRLQLLAAHRRRPGGHRVVDGGLDTAQFLHDGEAAERHVHRGVAALVAQDPAIEAYLGATGKYAVPDDARAALDRELGADPAFQTITAIDSRGRARLSTDPALLARGDLRSESYYQGAIQGSPFVSDVTIGSELPAPALFVARTRY